MSSYKQQLAKVTKLDTMNPFFPTLEECEKWYRILNQEIFNRSLEFPQEGFDIRRRRKTWGYHIWDDSKGTGLICINNRYNNKKLFIEVLAHEMIHEWQRNFGLPHGHGPSFEMWKNKFNRKGLNLFTVY